MVDRRRENLLDPVKTYSTGYVLKHLKELEMIYIVPEEDGTSIFSYKLTDYVSDVAPVLIFVFALQGWYVFVALFNTRKIRKKLRPLNELAMQAEYLGRIDPNDSRFADLEYAIEHANVESPRISTGDRDLESIEVALNSLLHRMQESRAQQVRFVSDASHELRTPIAVIQGYVNMLDRWGKEDPEVLNESIEALKSESMHMQELIEQLLFLARGDSGRNNLNRVDFDLGDIMNEVYEESLMIDEKHKYEFEAVRSDEDPGLIMNGDIAMIKQSVRIFIQNAAKYSDEGSTIKLRAFISDGHPAYSVQDEGIGMVGEDIQHIFERFYRSDVARNGETGGTGLGLAIAKWIVDAHDGTINVVSREEFGTRFTVVF